VDGILALARRTGVFTSDEIAVVRELVESELGNPQQRDYHSVVSEADGHIVGFACYGPTPMTDGTYDLYWIFVHPSYRGRSIGATLLAEVEKSVRQVRGRLLVVDTSSTRRYLRARRFYQSHGFRKTGEVKDFYRIGDSRLIYVKRFA
jgi:ribosomal protein S18 acetylase RimI-like enzyme